MNKKNLLIAILIVFILLLIVVIYQVLFSTPTHNQETGNNMSNERTVENGKELLDENEVAVLELERKAQMDELSKLYIVKCSACHGRDGLGPIGSSIAGKSFDYNYDKLLDYKNKKVPNTMMKGLLENTTLEEIKILAQEISQFK